MRGRSQQIMVILLSISIMLPAVSLLSDVKAADQGHSMVDFFTNPPNISFYDVEWNLHNYHYAIAVGVNTSTSYGVIYRYEADTGWTLLYTATAADTYRTVVYDSYLNSDTFYVFGTDNTYSLGLRVENADATAQVSYFGPIPGTNIAGAAFDQYRGDSGFLVCAGTMKDASSNDRGMIAVHNMSEADGNWTPLQIDNSTLLTDITFNGGDDTPLFVAVGANSTTASGKAFAYTYSKLWEISIPSECTYLNGVSWYLANPDGYAIAAGETSSGGVAYRIDINFPGPRMSYANSLSYKALKFVYGSNEGHISTPVPTAFANFTSVAVDSKGLPHIAYYDSLSHDLMYAHYNGKRWIAASVDTGGDVGMYCSIDTNPANSPIISYYDATNGYLKIAWFNTTSSSWENGVLDASGTAGKWTDLVVAPNYMIHISYIDDTYGLKYALWNNSAWSAEIVDASADRSTNIDLDSLNQPHISYVASGHVKYLYKSSGSWASSGFTAITTGANTYTSISVNSTDRPHIAAFSDKQFFYHLYPVGGTWQTEQVSVGGNPNQTAIDGDIHCTTGETMVIYSYHDTAQTSYPYSMNFTSKKSGGTWFYGAFDLPNTGVSPSMDYYGDYYVWVSEIPMDDPSVTPLAMFGVGWSPDGSQATIVGESGQILLYYNRALSLSVWNENGPGDLYSVAVKPPSSPGTSLAVGSSSTAVISYQVADTSTTISADAYIPHVNSLDFRDRFGTSFLNKQADVGSTYTFWMNTSYEGDWGKTAVNITAWYDFGDESQQYNQSAGQNYNFMLHYEPDPVDPYNRTGNWTLIWPNTEEVLLDGWQTSVVDNPSAGSAGINDGQDYYILMVNVTFGQQLAYAPGSGWTSSPDQLDRVQSFNDLNSWNFNITIYDRTVTTSRESKYDEFGIYAYTEISAIGNPSGSGAPGTTVSLSPESRIYLRTNVDYNVTVNITDLKNATGGNTITRDAVEVMNTHPDNTTGYTDISAWKAFPTGIGVLFVWGTSSGSHMPPLSAGTYTAGYQPGYSSSVVYTSIEWRIVLPPAIPEDHYTSTVTYQIDYL